MAEAKAGCLTKSTFTLWQLPEQTPVQMMSYVIQTVGGKLVVVDGGYSGDAPYLRKFLKERGNRVEAWFISHPHADHIDALTAILRDRGGLKIVNVYASLPEEDWVSRCEPGSTASLHNLSDALQTAHLSVTDLKLGDDLKIDGVRVEVLGVRNPEIEANALNNSSVVLRMSDKTKSVLFLGDLGVEGGEKLLNTTRGYRLHADYVQMAHHGQAGVGEQVYRTIAPSYCLWPTPLWLWDCDNGGGKGSGGWKTLEVRAWMDKLHIKRHYVTGVDGLSKIE